MDFEVETREWGRVVLHVTKTKLMCFIGSVEGLAVTAALEQQNILLIVYNLYLLIIFLFYVIFSLFNLSSHA